MQQGVRFSSDTRDLVRRIILGGAFFACSSCGGLGVERYVEAVPGPSLELRFVAAADRTDGEPLPRAWSAETVLLEPGAVLRAPHVARVQLLESGAGERLLVLVLHEEGRARLREATTEASGRRLALVAGGRVLATPSVSGPLDQREVAIRIAEAHVDRVFEELRR